MILDIETYALDGAAEFIEEPTAPSNYKDATKIEAYIADAKAKAVSRCALDPDLCRIVCIGNTPDHGNSVHVMIGLRHQDEADMLNLLWKQVAVDPVLIGFNLLSFDLPVLIRRSQYLGVDVPPIVGNLDKYRTPHIDLMERLSFNGKIKAHSLGFYCKRFGITVPDTTNGADIDAMVKADDWAGIEAHCRADVRKTRLLAERLGLVQPVAEVA